MNELNQAGIKNNMFRRFVLNILCKDGPVCSINNMANTDHPDQVVWCDLSPDPRSVWTLS